MFKNYIQNVGVFVKKHKIWTGIIFVAIVLVIVFGYRKATSTSAQTRYVLGTAEKGTLISTVSGSGQIASVNQVDIKPKVSGDITSINVQAGQTVKSGAIIAHIKATDALKTLRDAQLNLTSAQITYEKSLQSTSNDVSSAQNDLEKAYDDGFNAITDAFGTMPSTISDVSDILYNQNHSNYLSNSYLSTLGTLLIDNKDAAGREFDQARNEYQKNLTDFRATTRSSPAAAIEALINETYQTVKDLSSAEKDLNTVLNQIQSLSKTTITQLTTDQSTVSSAITKSNGYVSDLYNSKIAFSNAEKTLSQKKESINGVDTLDVQSAKLSLDQKKQAVTDAYQTLSDYTIRAPFDGVIAKVDIAVANSASSGTTIATLVTKDSFATLTLNEIDIAKVKVGDKATLTFDAIPDLSISGTVAEIDSLGTVSQGVVSYGVKIRFDTQDDRVKSGMSVSAAIVTDSKPDVLMVPSSAVKTSGGASYVQVLDNIPATASTQAGVTSATAPRQVPVEIGDSNDSSVEITSGLNEGDQIVTRTISASATASRTPTSAGILGGGAGAGRATGAVRTGGNVQFGR